MAYHDDLNPNGFPFEREFFEFPPEKIKYKELGEIYTEINGEKQEPGEWDAEIAIEILEKIMKNTITNEEIKVLREIVKFFLPDKNIDIDADMINKDWKSIVDGIKSSISQMSFEHLVETISR